MSDDECHYLPLTELAELFRRKTLSPVEITSAMLDRIARHDRTLSSYITVLPERAMDKARQAEAEIARGVWRGPLHGVPLAIKDLCDTSFAPSTAGMKVRADYVPKRSATVIERLEDGGAVILGKLAMTEGAFFEHHPEMPTPINPWNPAHWPGVSSSGSGVATAAGLCYASLGSDTGGSIRFPSAYCGLTGVKPTWGRVSRAGVFALAASLDHVGTMARNAADAAAVLARIAGRDPSDSTSLDAPVPDYLGRIGEGIGGVRLGVDEISIAEDTDIAVLAAVQESIDILLLCGACRREVVMPSSRATVDSWMSLMAMEAAAAHRDTFPSRADDYGVRLRTLLEQSRQIGNETIVETTRARDVYTGKLNELFRNVDLLILPVAGDVAPRVDALAQWANADPYRIGRFTAPFNCSGHPTITLQGGVDRAGVPIGIQLVARHLGEDLLLRAAHAFQQRTDWHARHPAL